MLAGEWWARKWSSPASVPYLGCFPYFWGAAFFVSTDWFVEGAQLCQCCRCTQGKPSLPRRVWYNGVKEWGFCMHRKDLCCLVCRPNVRTDLIPSDVQHHLWSCFHSFSLPRERAVSRTPEESLPWFLAEAWQDWAAWLQVVPTPQKRSFPFSGFFLLISGLSYFLNASGCA